MEECQVSELQIVQHDLAVEFQKSLEKMKLKQPSIKTSDLQIVVMAYNREISEVEKRCTAEVADREGGTSQGFAKAECLTKATQEVLDHMKDWNSKL
jgi:hypothetical protein